MNTQNISNRTPDNSFLRHVAEDLLQKFGTDLSRITVVFPNKRASLFLNEYLRGDTPVWAPHYLSISELFQKLSPYTLSDPIEAVAILYDIYREETRANETLDAFYAWGELLLSDFDDIDKSMADAESLLRNLKDIKALERTDYLSDEQKSVLVEFFRDFKPEQNSQIRQKFLKLWEKMLPIYTKFRKRLFSSSIAYEGALYRDVVERLIKEGQLNDSGVRSYVFVGFNVLSKAEHSLFKLLKKQGRALFYWDYDLLYTKGENIAEAGRFLREHLNDPDFKNELKDKSIFNNFSEKKRIEFVSAATENIQAKSATKWLTENLTPDAKRTAIVLCNESLLQPVLHALPENVAEVNITKGYPLSQTAAYRFLEEFFKKDTWKKAKSKELILNLLEKLEKDLQQEAAKIAKQETSGTPEDKEDCSARTPQTPDNFLENICGESYFKAYTIIQRFHSLIERDVLRVETPTLIHLIRQVARTASMPFHGEPVQGLQIMGVLETRNLDFDNILMLSVGEGILPKKANDASFIPYPLRAHFGLTTATHKTSVYAYYFYRLLQRAKYVRLVYNNTADGLQKGEMSRFMTQILCESGQEVRHLHLTYDQEIKLAPVCEIPKPQDLKERLTKFSPSTLNQYFYCGLSFYYQNVAGIREPQAPADLNDPRTFGTVFHEVAENIYKDILENHQGNVTSTLLSKYLDSKLGENNLLKEIERVFSKQKYAANEVTKSVIALYLKHLLTHDSKLSRFKILGTEKKDIEMPFSITVEGTPHSVILKGSIDRVDLVNYKGRTLKRIVDYKTGGTPEECKSIASLFEENPKRAKYVFQTLFYAYTLFNKSEKYDLAPALFYTRQCANPDYSPYITLGEKDKKAELLCYKDVHEDFEKGLRNLIEEIFNPEIPFHATTNPRHCEKCAFSVICKSRQFTSNQ